jgi:hypothetical protein
MGGTYVTIAGEEKFLQGFGGQTWHRPLGQLPRTLKVILKWVLKKQDGESMTQIRLVGRFNRLISFWVPEIFLTSSGAISLSKGFPSMERVSELISYESPLLLSNWLTPWSRILFQKITVLQLMK